MKMALQRAEQTWKLPGTNLNLSYSSFSWHRFRESVLSFSKNKSGAHESWHMSHETTCTNVQSEDTLV